MSSGKELFFTMDEYRSRLEGVRAQMGAKGIDTLLLWHPENIFYLTGYQTFGIRSFMGLILPLEGEPTLILRWLESILAERYSWVEDIVTWDDTDNPVEVTLQAISHRGYKGRIGVEETSPYFQAKRWRDISSRIPPEKYVDGSGFVENCRRIKSPQEIAYMREAARHTEKGMEAAISEAREGVTENDLAAAAMDAMTRAGSEYFAVDPIVTAGDRSGIPHTSYMRKVLKKGDTVLLELSGCYNRYVAPLMRSVTIGEPSPEIWKMHQICEDALSAAIAAVKPGSTAGDVDAACRNVILEAGYWDGFRKRTGYSVGFAFPQGWNEGHIISLKEGDQTVLEPGMVFHMPPSLRIYHKACVGVSETLAVTETGSELLTVLPRNLAQK